MTRSPQLPRGYEKALGDEVAENVVYAFETCILPKAKQEYATFATDDLEVDLDYFANEPKQWLVEAIEYLDDGEIGTFSLEWENEYDDPRGGCDYELCEESYTLAQIIDTEFEYLVEPFSKALIEVVKGILAERVA